MDNYQKLENLFENARDQKTSHSTLSQTKDLFKNSVGKKTPTKLPNVKASSINLFKTLIIMSLLASVVISIVLFNYSTESGTDISETNVISEKKGDKINSHESLTEVKKQPNSPRNEFKNVGRIPINSLQNEDFFTSDNGFELVQHKGLLPYKISPVEKTLPRSLFEDDYRYPVLTPDEIKANNKQKKKMVKAATRFSNLCFVPPGTFDFEGKKVSVRSFLMSRGEVSNLEYRTFLFDLLINDRKQDFLKAKPDQEKWTQIGRRFMDPMKDMYFSHPAYDQYPVVNVSIKGAEMYCVWLTKSRAEAHPTTSYNDFRIPTKAEWMIAATAEGKNPVYPWGTDLLINEHGCFMANFDYRIKDSVFWQKERMKIRNPKSNAGEVYTSDGATHTAKAISYNPNERGLYNLSGNVAELVYVGEEKSVGTCGGGWMNSASEVKLNAPDPYQGKVESHPNIGFRVIVTFEFTKE